MSVVFLPLFVTIIQRLRKGFNEIYVNIKGKLLTLFIVYFLFLMLRLFIYLNFRIIQNFYNFNIALFDNDIPLYSTEVIQALAMCYFLYYVTKQQRQN